MPRAIEIISGVVIILLVLPLLVFASVGLLLTGVRPLLVDRRIASRLGCGSHRVFNSQVSDFGLLLRRWEIDRLPALFQVVSGKIRLADIWGLQRGG